MSRMRLDQLLVARGLAASRAVAQALVLEGKVRVAGQVERKAAKSLPEDAEVAVESPPRFVSRGGEKLDTIPGVVPNLLYLPEGCAFSLRCGECRKECGDVMPEYREISPGHKVLCTFAGEH